MDRRQFLKGATGVVAAMAIPLLTPMEQKFDNIQKPMPTHMSVESVEWGESKTPQEILEDIESLIYDMRYPGLEGMA